MTRDEALAELGVTDGATADEIRRAYLRLLKTRKPETDPEGFRKLRDAFECVRAPRARARGSRVQAVIEVARAESAPTPRDGLAEVFHHANGGRPKKAARALSQLYEKATAEVGVTLPHPRFTLDLLVDLHSRGATRRARRLTRRFERWLVADGHSRRTLGPLVPMWVLLLELSEACGHLSTTTHGAIVRLLRDQDVEHARATLEELRSRDPETARSDVDALRAFAPSILRTIGAALGHRPYVAPPRVQQQPASAKVMIGFILGMFAIFAVIGSQTLHNETRQRESTLPLDDEMDADLDGGALE